MGRVYLIEKDEPAYTCGICNAQIALRSDPLWGYWLGYYEFSDAYNVTVAEDSDPVPYNAYAYWGYEVFCVNCNIFIGWKETEDVSPRIFRFYRGGITPPQHPPPPVILGGPQPPPSPVPPEIPPLPEGPPPETPPLPEGPPPETPPLPEGPRPENPPPPVDPPSP